MKIILNGEERALDEASTLAQLVDQLGMKPDRVAIERNRNIVSRAEWPATQLAEGDRLEIVHFVGGGLEEGERSSQKIAHCFGIMNGTW
jgi:thiamine biosynthesis protein ThiS